MLPTAITLRNYRSFPGPVRLELRPITLLFGINNAGKSALLRSLPLLNDSLAPAATAPLDLESPAVRGSSFEDLRWKGVGEDDDPDLGFSLSWDDEVPPLQVDFALRFYSDLRRLVLRRFKIQSGGVSTLEAEWQPVFNEGISPILSYEIRTPDNPEGALAPLFFQGLMPKLATTQISPYLETATQHLKQLGNQVQWLSASRQLPSARIFSLPTGPRWRMKPDGSDVATVLAASPDLLADVSAWYEKHLKRRLIVRDVPGGIRLMLTNLERAAFDIDLIDTGEGTIQVLSALTALALARRPSGGPGILAIEEPESHLHASLQRALAESLCETATAKSAPRIVLETHSEQLLLGVQLQIVRGVIPPDHVMVYWVHQLETGESLAEPVTFDHDARPQGSWPPDVFSDDTAVARQIVQARRDRENTAP